MIRSTVYRIGVGLAIATTLLSSGCRPEDNSPRVPVAVSHRTPQGIESYVTIPGGKFLITEFDDRYEVEAVEGVISRATRIMIDDGKDGTLELPTYPLETARDHQELYDSIFSEINSSE
ncbi:MAG: hypothetical protein ABIB47_05750 [Candidatus Woesearchaeota archaeon]